MKNYLTGCDILGADDIGGDGMGGMAGGMGGGYGALLSSLVETGTSIYSQQTAKKDAANEAREAARAAGALKMAELTPAQQQLAALQASQRKLNAERGKSTVNVPVETKKPFFKTGGGIAVIVTLSVAGLGGVGFALYKGLKK